MANKMLIDAAHPEETRVVVVRGNKVEEFDFESANRRQLRGNIYLAKVTRVEPSLQAAFIEYGGNRHGFLAFSEIHPDYYQIPVADRQALIEEEAQAERDAERDEERAASRRSSRGRERRRNDDETVSSAAAVPADSGDETAAEDAAATSAPSTAEAAADESRQDGDHSVAEAKGETSDATSDEDGDSDGDDAAHEDDVVEQVGGSADASEELPDRRQRPLRRQYKIQEVIKRRQVLLVQVVKEERGNKGAALTTYLSLAGRYSVLMPNTARGGGISRKITNTADRKRLKEMAQELEVPDGMGIILRTAGALRTKAEIKRDFEYLLRLWESVRELTLKSTAPALVYEEGSLIKRAIRDLYNKDIDEVHVSGEDGYREAKDFMRMLMPSHAKAVQPYRETLPIFVRNGVESQLDAMFSNQVTLKSGGYIVINPTEALVSIDVNSGRSTREHNIEDTALKTNLEAAEEISRQLRLRDLAGLIVIDFIDMEEKRNNRAVEKKLKDCLKDDRARIQVGRISAFGLMEMSRQRIRTGVLESSSVPCPHCAGSGFVRATPSIALHILRSVEETLLKSATHNVTIKTPATVALYILNQKRGHLRDLEMRFGVTITVVADESFVGATHFALERGELAVKPEPSMFPARVQVDTIIPEEEEDEPAAEDEGDEETSGDEDKPVEAEAAQSGSAAGRHPDGQRREAEGGNGDEGGRRRRRRRRRRGGRGGDNRGESANGFHAETADQDSSGDEADAEDTSDAIAAEEVQGEVPAIAAANDATPIADDILAPVEAVADAAPEAVEALVDEEPATVAEAPSAEPSTKPKRRRSTKAAKAEATAAPAVAPADEAEPTVESAPTAKPKPRRRKAAATKEPSVAQDAVAAAPETETASGEETALEAASTEKDATPAKKKSTRAPRKTATTARAKTSKAKAGASADASDAQEAEPAAASDEQAAQAPEVEPAQASAPAKDRPKRTGWWSRAKATITGG
ncbi:MULTISPECIES: ribonuclease E/G [unclassified Chelatococcus]|uniref:ribonuclease E/G n=1 Tax=unclassified Chelatococcus TaxID=2638111 RepID=UPI001BCE8E28|nr:MULTISPECIES: ribonuclease E/G [unclassified Chelatococcus]CAH1672324.1 Ribonuclease E [Hyphomicrobiales bacterium]MBS7738574.1 Rne/Rng family ribonuclease [Chelatococcus sp. HY11]MBX3542978.1 Rne/Rng family ribonuclease [Chelatococcus sp.]MCO5076896.1 Rne/Rng family ribonuclease [Chelatococcus sp.]CAH1675448.1 Ribonuclease E [Hyphomicrobiales bacterium]